MENIEARHQPSWSHEISAKRPPGLHYQVNWADLKDTQFIKELNLAEGRQIMNLSFSPTARLFVIKDLDNEGRIVAWCGLDLEHDRAYPESFSGYVLPEYRGFRLSYVLEYVRCQYTLESGFDSLYLRMEGVKNSQLISKRVASEFYTSLDPRTLDERYRSMCKHCHLFGASCTEQQFLKIDLRKMFSYVQKKIGSTHSKPFKQFYLQSNAGWLPTWGTPPSEISTNLI